MDENVRQFVRQRADYRCEYCGLPESQSPLASLHIEHVRPRKHGGSDEPENLALACIDCNLCKGSNVAGYDSETGALTELYNPRQLTWSDHFERQGSLIVGRSAVGRTTIAVLRMNSEERVELRMLSN